MSEIKLKPCPFCWGEVKWKEGSIVCDNCDLRFRNFGNSYEPTNENWNTRKPMERILKKLEKEKSDWNYDYNVPINKAIEIVKEVGGLE